MIPFLWWLALLLLIRGIGIVLHITSFLLLSLWSQDLLSNNHPITIPIPLIINSSASHHKKGKQDLLMVGILNGATPSVKDRHMGKGGNVKGFPQKVRLKGMKFDTMTQRLNYKSNCNPHTYHILIGGLGLLATSVKCRSIKASIST